MKSKYTERYLQDRIYMWRAFQNHRGMCCNAWVFRWESDFVSITTSGFAHEYEIKISKSDFKRDSEKVWKHKVLLDRYEPKTAKPNYFWYVTPPGLVELAEVPEYAGLWDPENGIIQKPKKVTCKQNNGI